jgi:hypothetical protein
VIGGDFFKSVPAGGDIYVLQQIVHDWGDERAVAILARSMARGAHVLLIEQVMSLPGVPHFSKLLDIEMLLPTEQGRERTEAEYGSLLAQAGLKLTRVLPAFPSAVNIVEATAA